MSRCTPACLFVLLFLLNSGSFAQSGFVHRSGTQLLDGRGHSLRLTSVNLGGWLLWEGWIMGSGFTSESSLKKDLVTLVGDAEASAFVTSFYRTYVTRADIRAIRANGYNSVRVPFNHRLFTDTKTYGTLGFELLDSLIARCRDNHLYLILDMHAAVGGQNKGFISDPEPVKLWQSDANRQQTIDCWLKLVQRYKNEPVVAAYDLLNEPDAPTPGELIRFYTDLITAVRRVDPNHLLLVEGNTYAHSFTGFTPFSDPNYLFSFHYYPWFQEKNKAGMLQKTLKGVAREPVWCGEWGEDIRSHLDEIRDLLYQNPLIVGDAFWTYKRVYTGNSKYPVYTVNQPDSWKRLMRWSIYHLVKPTPTEARTGMRDYLQAIRFENCTSVQQRAN